MQMACCCAVWMTVLPIRWSGFFTHCIAQQPLCSEPYQHSLVLSLSLSEVLAVDITAVIFERLVFVRTLLHVVLVARAHFAFQLIRFRSCPCITSRPEEFG